MYSAVWSIIESKHYVRISYYFYYSLFKKKSIVTTIDITLLLLKVLYRGNTISLRQTKAADWKMLL